MEIEQNPPDVPALRALAAGLLENAADLPFQELFPGLALIPDDVIDESGSMSMRLRNVLRRWKGTEWGPYLTESSASLIRRRNCGLRSLGEFLWRAEEAARPGPKVLADRPPEAELTLTPTAFGDIPLPSLEWAFLTIAAWGRFERGRTSFRDAMRLAWVSDALPYTVASAIAAIDEYDLQALAWDWSQPFDVKTSLDSVAGALDNRDREILGKRTLALGGRETLDDVGRSYNLTRERMRQLQIRAETRLVRLIGTPDSSPIRRTADRLRDDVGVAIQLEHLPRIPTLTELELSDIDSFGMRLLVWAAGPYEIAGDWLVIAPARGLIASTKRRFSDMTSLGPIPLAEAEQELHSMGFQPAQAIAWLVSLGGFRVFEDSLIRWTGSLADKAEAVLSLTGSPMQQEDLLERIGNNRSLRSFLNQLQGDRRFKRTGLRTYGLAQWDHDEYTGIANEIQQEIGRQGGSASLDHLVAYVSATYGVSASSVRSYALGPRFSRTTDGLIQLVRGLPSRTYRKPPEMIRGMFWREGSWFFRLRVSEAMLGGSGTVIPEGVARAFGLEPLSSLTLTARGAEVRLTWPTLSPQLGSIRPILEADDAEPGDHILLSSADGELSWLLIREREMASLQGVRRLGSEIGASQAEPDTVRAVAQSLALSDDVPSVQGIRRRLLARGETDLAGFLGETDVDEPLMLSLSSAKFVEVRWSN